ncbi:MAG: hypothetical protein K1X75_01205 [Leptospirales bacterium]|nr:hypothetical protein [Leptospirales bacterium]
MEDGQSHRARLVILSPRGSGAEQRLAIQGPPPLSRLLSTDIDLSPRSQSAHPFHSAADRILRRMAQLFENVENGELYLSVMEYAEAEGSCQWFRIAASLGEPPEALQDAPKFGALLSLDTVQC